MDVIGDVTNTEENVGKQIAKPQKKSNEELAHEGPFLLTFALLAILELLTSHK